MTKLTILWVAIISLLTVLFLFLFHGNAFTECYTLNASILTLGITGLSPMLNCALYTGITLFFLLFLGPVLTTLVIYAVYVIIFNRPMPSAHYILWLIWFVLLYYIMYEITLLPAI